jgi:AcrR family transcriptional regulator
MAARKKRAVPAVRRKARRTRAHGEESRQRILDAAAEIASERGYDGTSIALVSERSGLPASSIYWHFEDKDHLIAAVIESSFDRFLRGASAWAPPKAGADRRELFSTAIRRTAKALADAPDFIRLGLMLALERRPEEATARTMFLQVRAQAYKQVLASCEAFFAGEVDVTGVRALATLAMASADGLFIAHEIDDGVDLPAAFELFAVAILGAADHLISRSNRSKKR